MVKTGQLPHAFLFSGPVHIGKKAVALELAKIILCKENKKPCQNCVSCREIEHGIHPDVFLLEPKARDISIEEIRRLTENLALKALGGDRRIAIINEAHQMRQASQNSLLKTLEEPAGSAIILLLSSRPEMLLPTIRSRVQEIKFFLVSKKEMENEFESLGFPREKIKAAVSLAKGRPGIAINFLNNPVLVEESKKTKEDFLSLFGADILSRFGYARTALVADTGSASAGKWIEYTREFLFSLLTKEAPFEAQQFIPSIVRFLHILQEREFLLLTTNINQRLALEALLLEMPQIEFRK